MDIVKKHIATKDIVTIDLGGTHARFAIATLADGQVQAVSDPVTLKTAEHTTFHAAWNQYAALQGGGLPRAAAIAVACPVNGDVIKMTNNPWVIRADRLSTELGLDHLVMVNDFGAVGRAIGQMAPEALIPVSGPEARPPAYLPDNGVISVIGPGTGLGVALILRRNGQSHVIETEGGHSDFAPLDTVDDAILARLRPQFRRVSVERIASGPGLLNIYQVLAAIEGKPATIHDDKLLWTTGLEGTDPLAVAALDRFMMILGSVAGDIALTQGAKAVVIAGGIGARLAEKLPSSGFADRFHAKGRFENLMRAMPVKLMTDPHAGLIGAAAAFLEKHPS